MNKNQAWSHYQIVNISECIFMDMRFELKKKINKGLFTHLLNNNKKIQTKEMSFLIVKNIFYSY